MLNLGCGNRTHNAWVNIDYSPMRWFLKLWFLQRLGSSRLPYVYLNQDLRHGIPFAGNTADVVYCSQLLEHLEHKEALPFVQEIYRVLKPGGILRLVVPDLEKAASRYLAALLAVRSGEKDAKERHEWETIWLLDQMVRSEPGGEMAKWLHEHRQSPLVQGMKGICTEIAEHNALAVPRKRILTGLISLFQSSNPASTGELHRWMYDEISLSQLFEKAKFREVHRISHLSSGIPNWASYELDNNSDGSPYHPESIWIEAIK